MTVKKETTISKIVNEVTEKMSSVFDFAEGGKLDYSNHPPTPVLMEEPVKRFQESGEYKAMMLRIQKLEEKMKFFAEFADSQNLAKGKQIEYLIKITTKQQSAITKLFIISAALLVVEMTSLIFLTFLLKGTL